MSDTTQLIKDKFDVVDFLKQYLELKPSGKNFKALCPFHKEKTPSFMVSPERQSWHCFGSCNEGGDIIKFLMKYENIEFYDALKILAEKAGIEISKVTDRDFKAYNTLYNVVNEAKNFFKSNLAASQSVKDYLKERGLKEETIEEFEIGFAPENSDLLTRHLLKLGYSVLDIEKAGLAVKTERGTYWDRFRGRVMFPIFNQAGKTVGFTGRILPAHENLKVGKYVNSPETPIFQKSKILYGFHKTKNDVREANSAVIVEGQMDLLMAWQDGVKNIVATSGTALTSEHLKMLRRLADELIFSFDADDAGQIASERAIDLAAAHDFSVKLLVINEKGIKDPADLAKQNPGKLKELLGQAKSAMDYYFQKYILSTDDIRAKKKNLRIILLKIKNLASSIERSHWLKGLSNILGIEERVLMEEMEMLPSAAARAENPGQDSYYEIEQKLSRRELISQRLLGIMLHIKSDPQIIGGYSKYFPPKYLHIYQKLANQKTETENKNNQDDLDEIVNIASLRFSFENQQFDAEQLKKEEKKLLRELKVEFLKEERRRIGELIKKFEEAGDETCLEDAMRQHDIISKELQNS